MSHLYNQFNIYLDLHPWFVQREIILVRPSLTRLLDVRHSVHLDHGMVDQFVHIFLRCDVQLENFTLPSSYNELSLSPSETRRDSPSVVAG